MASHIQPTVNPKRIRVYAQVTRSGFMRLDVCSCLAALLCFPADAVRRDVLFNGVENH
jgi:hypothetical protein